MIIRAAAKFVKCDFLNEVYFDVVSPILRIFGGCLISFRSIDF